MIHRCLEAIAADRRQADSVLVVADRCTDATAEIARSYRRAGARARRRRRARPRRRASGGARARPRARMGCGADARRRLGDRAGLLRRLRARDGRRDARRAGAQRERPRPLAGSGGIAGRVHAAGDHDPPRARRARAVGPAARHRHGDPARAGAGPPIPGAGIRGSVLHARPDARRSPLPSRRRGSASVARARATGARSAARRCATRPAGCPPRGRTSRG